MNRRSLLLGLAGLGGCSLLPQTQAVQRRDWPLDLHRDAASRQPPRGRVLLVRNLRAAPGLEQRGLQWLQRDGSVHVDFYEQWAVPPAQAVEDDIRGWLANSGVFSAVVAPGSRLNAGFVLEGELQVFMADLNTGTARVAVALVLLDQRPGTAKVLLQKTETAEAKLASTDAPAIVAAIKTALKEVLQQIEADVVGALR